MIDFSGRIWLTNCEEISFQASEDSDEDISQPTFSKKPILKATERCPGLYCNMQVSSALSNEEDIEFKLYVGEFVNLDASQDWKG